MIMIKRSSFCTFLLFFLFLFLIFPKYSFSFRDLGIPIKEAVVWGAYIGPGKSGEKDTIYVSLGRYNESMSLLAINPDTGETKQFDSPIHSEMGSWGFTIDNENRIYVGTYYNAHLLRFDPKTEKWEDLGRPAGATESFICALTTSPDGKIWGGTFPSAKLFSYDPKTGETKDYGRMDEKQFYCYPIAGLDGLIYCAIRFEKTNIIIFDPMKGEKISLIPIGERKPGWLSLIKGEDGKIYSKLPSGKWFRITESKKLVEVKELEIPFPKRSLPDGREFQLIENHTIRIFNPIKKEKKDIPLRYEASGAFIFLVGSGPEDRIYGSSMLPLRLFVYDPKDKSLINLGKASYSNGEIYSMVSYDGKLYFCSYPNARISVYDPKKSVRFGDDEDANPRDLGPLGEGQDRPRAMIKGPNGKLYIGTYPDYGLHGGALSVYDPKTKEKRVYRHIISNQSIASLAYIKKFNLIVAGSSIKGGGGTRAIEKEARIILWDPKEEKKIFEIIPIAGAKTVLSISVINEGLVYGITDQEKVFVFDPEKKEIKKVFDLGLKEPLEISLIYGQDGLIYGLTKSEIFLIDPKKDQIKTIAQSPVPITAGIAISGGKIYFGSYAHLYEFEIPISSLISK
jgi:outer membrane protein assembly factor BamB